MDNPSAWLKQQRGLARHPIRQAGIAAAATTGTILLQTYLLAHILDALVFARGDLDVLQPWLWALFGAILLRTLFARLADHWSTHSALAVKQQLRGALFEHLQRVGSLGLGHKGAGELAHHLHEGIDALDAYYARFLPAMTLAMLVPLAIFALVLPLDWLSALVLLLTAPLIPLFMVLIGKGAERLNQRQWRQLARLSAHFLEVVQGLSQLKLFNASRREAELVARLSDNFRRRTLAVLRVAFLSSAVLEFLAALSIALIAVFIGFRLLEGNMDFFDGLFILLLAPEFYLPLRQLASQYHARMEAIAAAEGLMELWRLPARAQPVQTRPLPGGPLDIRIEGLGLHYPGRNEAALADLDLHIPAGQTLALVGPSGAGKTSLLNLLAGLATPDEGLIRANGIPLAELASQEWRSQIAWMPQSPRLFAGSLLDNIRLGRPEASAEAVREAARRAHALEFIDALPDGLEHRVGEEGTGLSGGQIRRIALARVFLRDAPLVLLDEPTASLDAESERLITASLRELARGRTLIFSAHRLATLALAERILVLEDGRVREDGDHRELAAREGLYRRLLGAATSVEARP